MLTHFTKNSFNAMRSLTSALIDMPLVSDGFNVTGGGLERNLTGGCRKAFCGGCFVVFFEEGCFAAFVK